eukprot:1328682-Amorphochlora_amoeboformis.AAC.1
MPRVRSAPPLLSHTLAAGEAKASRAEGTPCFGCPGFSLMFPGEYGEVLKRCIIFLVFRREKGRGAGKARIGSGGLMKV